MSDTPRINLFSDTQTRPTAAMRDVIARAEVGDEQQFADPSVNALCERVADLLGHEAAVFLPSGTMANEISLLVHCRPGDEVIADATSHILNFEGGGPGALGGVQIRAVDGERGVFGPEAVAAAVRAPSRYAPTSRLVALENTANLAGGTVWPVAAMAATAEAARSAGLAVHLDGARLPNAWVAAGVSAVDYGRLADSVWIDLSKGLGCPMGAVLAGSADFVEAAWAWKQRMGGALRQAGMMAAAGTYALDHHVDRLADDHANARAFAERAARDPNLAVDLDAVQSNMVYVDVSATGRSAAEINRSCLVHGVAFSPMGDALLRVVTHLDVTAADVIEAADVLTTAATP